MKKILTLLLLFLLISGASIAQDKVEIFGYFESQYMGTSIKTEYYQLFSNKLRLDLQSDLTENISFAANVCIPNARKVIAAAKSVAAERLLIETDTPDQTPPARRPADNEPAFIVEVARRLAELREIPLEQLARETFANAERVLGLPPALPRDPPVE